MADLKAQLEISADASGVEAGVSKAKRSLADLGATASAAGKQASDGLASAGQGGERAATKVDAATKNIVGSIQRQIAALESGSKSGSRYYEALANQRGANLDVLKPYLDQLDAVKVKQQTVADGFAKLGIQGRANLEKIVAGERLTTGLSSVGQQAKGAAQDIAQASLASAGSVRIIGAAADATAKKVGLSAKEMAFALRGVPAQFTDIATSLASGQRPLQVFLQQGGQLKDMFGGIAPAARALGGYVLGLVNPFTIAAAAAGLLAVAYNQGSKEADAYNAAIILSGNAAGVTRGQLQAMAQSVSAIAGTQGAAAEALSQLAQSGDVAGGSLQRFALIAIKMERDTGQAVSETVKQFSALARDPLTASTKLNESIHHLTLTTYAQIRAFEEQGRTADAAAVAQKAYADAMESRTGQIEQNLGLIERAWKGIKDEAKKAWDAMLNVGRSSSLQDQLSQAQSELAARQQRGPLNPTTSAAFDKGNEALRQRIAFLQESIRLDTRVADAAKASADQVKARIQFDKDGEKFLSDRLKMEREIAKARNEGAAAGASQAEIEKRVADIRASFAKKGPNVSLGIDKAQLNSDIAAIKEAGDQLVGIYGNAEKIVEAQRSAGLLSDREYYESKREFIQLESAAQEDALQKQIARYQQERLSGKDKIDNDKKIAEAESKLAIVRAESSAKLEILFTQQDAAVRKLQLSYLSARQAAQDYFDSIEKQQNRELEGIGQGNERRGFNAGINQIEDRYAGQRRDLENQRAQLELEGKFNEEAKAQYDQRLAIINEFQAKSIASFTTYYDKLIEKQRDFAVGATEALANYISESANVAKQTEQLFTHAFSSMEDALVEFTKTGKLNFKNLADAIVSDINRIIVRQQVTQPLAELIQSGFGSGEGLGGFIKKGLGGLFGNNILPGESGGVPTSDTIGKVLGGGTQNAAIAANAAAVTASTAAETAAAAAIATASATSAAALGTVAASASAAAGALAAVAASGGVKGGSELVSLFGSGGFGTGNAFGNMDLGAFLADGTNYVPRDNFPAVLHKGEAVVPAKYNPAAGGKQEEQRAVTVTLHQSFAPNTDRRTIDQAAAAAAMAVRRAGRNL